MSRPAVLQQLACRFNRVRKLLLTEAFADRLDTPLAFWSLPEDRYSPVMLMSKTLRELCETEFEQLYATSMLGEKKFHRLIELLNRAANSGFNDPLKSGAPLGGNAPALVDHADAESHLSEALWAQWRQTIIDNDLGSVKLGRLAPSLQHLPRVIWNTPLDAYTSLSLAQMRDLKTHGEKRVSAVLEVFAALQVLLAGHRPASHLIFCIVPRFVGEIERWINSVQHGQAAVEGHEIRRFFFEPLMAQIETDAGPEVVQLAKIRLHLDETGDTIRDIAERKGVTRARVYQQLGEISAIMHVRWPEGFAVAKEFQATLHARQVDPVELRLLDAVVELFFPCERDDQHVDGEEPVLRLHAQDTDPDAGNGRPASCR